MPDVVVDALFLSFQQALVGRYSLERELGRGGMGVVYLAREVRLDRSVAIKLLPPELATSDKLRDRFMREARTAARLSHPYIVPIYSVDEIDGFVFYVMAHVEGETLGERVAARGPLAPHDATRILREVAWALAYAHAQGVVHRDVKPANILLEKGGGRAMVTDFGIARIAEVSGETGVGEVVGTPEYMSPEQAAGETVDGRSDLYALGVVGFFALTGTVPFTAPSAQAVLAQHLTTAPPPLSTVARAVPRPLAQAIDRCLQKDPAARFERGEALADALEPAIEKRNEVPVPIRVFLDRRRNAALVALTAITPIMAVNVVVGLANNRAAIAGVGLVAVATLVGVGIPLGVLLFRLRRLLRLGYGPDDVVAGLHTAFRRRREEFLFEFGQQASLREKAFGVVSVLGLTIPWLLVAPILLHIAPRTLIPVAVIAFEFGVIAALISTKWWRLRAGKDSLWTRFWQGRIGRGLARIAGIKLGRRAAPADRPTEMALAMSVESLYDGFSKEVRRSLGDVPEILRGLGEHARAARKRIEALNAALVQAQDTPGHGAPDRQGALVADLRETRTRAEARLAEVVTALENVRLDLLRIHAGVGTVEGVTQDLAAAKALGEEVDALLAGQHEVAEALAKR